MRWQAALWMFAGLLAAAADQALAANADRGAELAALCASCHLLDGRNTGIPSIIGLSAEKLASKLQAFKSNERSKLIMHAVSRSLSQEEIEALVHYLASRGKATKPP